MWWLTDAPSLPSSPDYSDMAFLVGSGVEGTFLSGLSERFLFVLADECLSRHY